MLEIPEANTLAKQVQENLRGKVITGVTAASSPHKFAWYHGDPADYPAKLLNTEIEGARAIGGMVEIFFTSAHLLLSDGVNLRFHQTENSLPLKHQLLLKFQDGTFLSASVQMYGGLSCWGREELFENPYYLIAKSKPSPLSGDFTNEYFSQLLSGENVIKLSLKAVLATEQRIPGLGNGVLQDILWIARSSPHRKVSLLSEDERSDLYKSIKHTLTEMTSLGGRETENDLFGNPGGYPVILSAKNNGKPCPVCKTPIIKEAYMGGSVYYCSNCQQT